LVSQILLAGPLMAMYEGSIWMAKIFRKKEKAEGEEEKEASSAEKEGENSE